MSLDRRSFLATLAGSAAALALTNRRAFAALDTARRKKLERVGIQVYTLRSLFSKDPVATLEGIAKIGYKEVEFAGYGGKTPQEIRDLLKSFGMTAPSTHLGLNAITPNPQKVFDDSKVMGHEWVTVPSLPGGPKATVDDWKKIAEQFNAVGAQAKAAGLKLGFHNHNAEFRKIGDVVPLEILIQETDPALVDFEMDIYWVVNGGGDPIDLLTRYPTRFKMLHAKDSAGPPQHVMKDVGAGTIDFKKILGVADKNGIKHVFVEHDSPGPDPMASAKASFDYLSKVEF